MYIYTHHLYKISANNNKFIVSNENEFSLVFNLCNKNPIYEIIFLNSQSFAILNKFKNKYLSAYSNGSLEFQASDIGYLEIFYILPKNELFLIESLIHKYKDIEGEIITKCTANIENGVFLIKAGNSIIKPSFLPLSTISVFDEKLEYRKFDEVITFSKNRELIYYCVYGKDEYYECLKLSILSLINFGKYSGDILIKCDNPDKIMNLFSNIKNRIIIKEIDAEKGIFNRYIFEDDFYKYDRINYIDADILIINPYINFSRSLENADFFAFSENPLENKENFIEEKLIWFGVNYFKSANIQSKNPYILNSGFFIINNFEKCKYLFNRIMQYRYLESDYGDQPFFNLALYNCDLNLHIFERGNYLEFTNKKSTIYENLHQIFIHYNSGVGGLSKLDLMLENYNYLIDCQIN